MHNLHARSRRILGLLAPLLLLGCNTVTTTVEKSPVNSGAYAGIPYFLPQGDVSFGLTVNKTTDGKFQSLDFATSTKLVPDRTRLFLLKDGSGLFTRTNRKLTLADGLLTSLHTENEGQADQALQAVASVWANTLQISALKGAVGAPLSPTPSKAALLRQPLSGAQTPPETLRTTYAELLNWPNVNALVDGLAGYLAATQDAAAARMYSTEAEQAELLLTAPANQAMILLAGDQRLSQQDYGRFFTFSVTADAADLAQAARSGDKSDQLPAGPTGGIYVRVPVPVRYTAELELKPAALYLHRLQGLEATLGDLKKTLADADTQRADLKTQRASAADLQKNGPDQLAQLKEARAAETDATKFKLLGDKIADLTAALLDADKTLADLDTKLKALDTAQQDLAAAELEARANIVLLYDLCASPEKPAPRTQDLVFKRDTVALVPAAYAVNIPLTDALVGKTTHDLLLTGGVLTSTSVDRPSWLVETLKVPLNITNSLIASLTQLVQLRLNLANNERDLAKAQADLEQAKENIALAKVDQEKQAAALRADISDSQAKIKANEKQILQLEQDIAKLKQP